MRKLLLFTSIIFAGHSVYAQPLATKTGLRLYEHHSTSICGPKGANPSQAGFDFVNNNYINSFDSVSFGPHTDGTDTAIDMVEHIGTGGNFGFTSGVSTIWAGDIKGNGTTMWMQAPMSFSYANSTDVNQLKTAYSAAQATQTISVVQNNAVYIGRIRNSDRYVAVQCYNVTNNNAGNTFFDFDYKYGVWNPNTTDVNDMEGLNAVHVYPNPTTDKVSISNTIRGTLSVKIMSMTGQQISAFVLHTHDTKTIDLNSISRGMYTIVCTAENGKNYVSKLVKQ